LNQVCGCALQMAAAGALVGFVAAPVLEEGARVTPHGAALDRMAAVA
jgi:hypothetical protein